MKITFLCCAVKISSARGSFKLSVDFLQVKSILLADHGRRFIGQSITALFLNCNWLSITADEPSKRAVFSIYRRMYANYVLYLLMANALLPILFMAYQRGLFTYVAYVLIIKHVQNVTAVRPSDKCALKMLQISEMFY